MVYPTDDVGRAFCSVSRKAAAFLLLPWQVSGSDSFRPGDLNGERLVKEYVESVGRDRRRWLAFVREHTVRRIRVRMDAHDVLQDAFCSALDSAKAFPGSSTNDVPPWFRHIVLRSLYRNVKVLQAKKRQVPGGITLSLDFDDLPDRQISRFGRLHFLEPESPAPGPEAIVLSSERSGQILGAVFSLGSISSRLIILVDAFEASIVEAAQELSLSPDATRSRLWRARDRLRELLRKDGLEPCVRKSVAGTVIPGNPVV